jgi:hypothetical protein
MSRSCRAAITLTPARSRRSCRPRRHVDDGGAGRAHCRGPATTTGMVPSLGSFGLRAGSGCVWPLSLALPPSPGPEPGGPCEPIAGRKPTGPGADRTRAILRDPFHASQRPLETARLRASPRLATDLRRGPGDRRDVLPSRSVPAGGGKRGRLRGRDARVTGMVTHGPSQSRMTRHIGLYPIQGPAGCPSNGTTGNEEPIHARHDP